jgi:hypothetical protein
MRRGLAVLGMALVLGFPVLACAHDGHIATAQLRRTSEGWRYEFMAPQHALEEGLESWRKGQAAPARASEGAAFREAMVAFLKESLSLTVTPAPGAPARVHLGAGRFKLGSHQSYFDFALEGMPSSPALVTVRIATLAQRPGQTVLLRLIDGDRTERFVLTAENDFAVTDRAFFSP